MTKLARHRREELLSRIIFTILLICLLAFLGFFSWRLWQQKFGQQQFSPKPTVLVDVADRKRVETPCYEFYVPNEYELMKNADCLTNTYARPRKYSYLQVSPYYDVQDEQEMIDRWQSRWLTLGARETSRDRVIIGGLPAWRIEELYPQNNESFVSYLVLLENPMRVDGRDRIRAFELRAWATTDSDKAFASEVVQDWRWRF